MLLLIFPWERYEKKNIRFEENPNLSSIPYLVLTLRPTSSHISKCPHSALTFCDLLNERTPPPPKKNPDRIASQGLALFQPQAHRVIISSCQECREFPAFSLSSGLASERTCDGEPVCAADSSRCIDACLLSGGLLTERIQRLSKVHLQLHGLRREQRRRSPTSEAPSRSELADCSRVSEQERGQKSTPCASAAR